jgi:4'-phosphopantetheinyl transferase
MITCYARTAKLSQITLADVFLMETVETAALARFRNQADRLRHLVGRLLSRQMVAELTQQSPLDIAVRLRCRHCGSTEHGKPYALFPGGSLPLSISHSAGRVLVATTRGSDVGVDIELIDADRYRDELLDHIEAPLERGSTPRNATAFTRLWTHKEAVLKCTGDGLMRAPSSFAVDFSRKVPVPIDASNRFSTPIGLATLDFSDGYAGAVAVSGAESFMVELRSWKH